MNLELLDLLGPSYVISLCWAAYEQEAKEFSYKRYMAAVCRLAGENIAAICKGQYIVDKWGDEPGRQEEAKDGDEVAADVIRRAGLKLKGKNDEPI